MSLLRIRGLSALIVLVFMTGCARSHPRDPRAVRPPTSQPSGPRVSIDNFSFSPAEITVSAGQTVTWVNHDDVPHTVTANDKAFASKALDTDDSFSQTFTQPGTYPYYCAVHTHMTGQVIVKQ